MDQENKMKLWDRIKRGMEDGFEAGLMSVHTITEKAGESIELTRLRREKCACGRTLIKMDKVFGRSDDMLIISGVNVFPSQIEALLLEIDEVEPQYRLVVRKKGYLDQLIVQVEGKKEVYEAGDQKRFEVEAKIAGHIRGMMGIGIEVNLVEPKFIARSEGKALRVVDERPKQLR